MNSIVRSVYGLAFAVLFLFGSYSLAYAAANDNVTINYEVAAINEIELADLAFNVAVDHVDAAGANPVSNTVNSSYSITTNCSSNSKKMTIATSENFPSFVYLGVTVGAPAGAAGSTKWVSSTSQDAVTGIDAVVQNGISMNMYMIAWPEAGIISSSSLSLILTLTDS